jgi:type I restriction enzyme S subunit
LAKLLVPVPPLPFQIAASSVLNALDERIETLRKANSSLEAIARAIFKSWFVDFDPVQAKAEGREPDGMDADTAALFPRDFEDSELEEIPLGWTVREVRDVSISNRKSIGKNHVHNIEYIDISSVEPGRIASSTMCNLAEAPSRAKRLVSDGDTIWSCVRPNRRSFVLIMEPANNLVVSTGFVTLTATEIPFSFLYLSVTTSQFVEYLTLRADGAAYPAVRPDTFESAKVIVPSESILNRFHEIAEPMLRKVAANNRQAKTLADLRDTLLPRLISGKLRVPEAEAIITKRGE